MPQAVAWVATAIMNSIVAITGSTAIAEAVGSFVWSFASWRGVAQLAFMAYAVTRKPPKIADPGMGTTFRADPQAARRFIFGEMGTAGVPVFSTTYYKNKMLAYVVAVSGGECEGFQSFTMNGDAVTLGTTGSSLWTGVPNGVTSGDFKNRMWIFPLGKSAAAFQALGFGDPAYVPEWTSKHTLDGVHKYVWLMQYDKDVYASGVPEPLAIFRGQLCYDPRKDSTYPGGSGSHRVANSATWEWTQCGPLIALKWALGIWENDLLVGGLGLPWELLDVDTFVSAANVAEANGWKCNGMATAEDDKAAVMSAICATFGGDFVPRAGRLGVTYGAAQTSVITLTDDDVAETIKLDATRTRRERKNIGTARYVEPNDRYALKTIDEVSSSTYLDEDGGKRRPIEYDLSLVTDRTQAAQLTALKIANSREHRSITGTWKPIARVAKEGQAVTINSATLGVNEKYIVEKRSLQSDGSVRLELRLETDSKYAWALGKTQTPPTPRKLIPFNPSSVDAPRNWKATGINQIKGLLPYRALRVTGVNDEALAASTIIEYREGGETDWSMWGEYLRGVKTVDVLLIPGTYDVAVSYRVVGGAEYVTERQVIAGASVPNDPAPPVPTSFAAYETGSLILLRAGQPSTLYPIDYEFSVGETIEAAIVVASGDKAEVMIPQPVISDGSNRYWVRTVARYGGAYSARGLFFDLDRAPVPNRNEVGATDFKALDWPGALHDLTAVGVSGSKYLALDADAYGVRKPFGDFFGEIDLGASYRNETKLTTSAGRDAAPPVTLADAASITLADAADWVLYSPAEPTSEVSLTSKIAIDKAPSDLLVAARLNGTLAATGGTLDGLAAGATFAECWRSTGLDLRSASSIGWGVSIGSAYTLICDVRPAAALSADCVFVELETASGLTLQIRYDATADKLVAIDSAGASVKVAAPAWSTIEPISIGLAQNGATRALAWWGRDKVVTYGEAIAATIGSIVAISLSPSAGGTSLLEAASIPLADAATLTLEAAAGASLAAPVILADLEVRSSVYDADDFAVAVDRGPAGFGPFHDLLGSTYTYQRAMLWQRIEVAEGYGDAVKIENTKTIADMPDLFAGGDAEIYAGGTRVLFGETFTEPPTQINVTLVSGSTAVKVEIVAGSVDETGATFIAKDAGGTSVDAGINFQVRGR